METLHRIIANLFGRLDGPLHFRFIMQPAMAILFAIKDGINDAKLGNPAYFWAIVFTPDHRKTLIKGGWKSVGKIFILAVVLDVIYQLKVNHRIYPGETLIVAIVLAIIPYILIRGPVNRLISLRKQKSGQSLQA
jgi:hypothetical protein